MWHFLSRILLLLILVPTVLRGQSMYGDRIYVDSLSSKIPQGVDTLKFISNTDFLKTARIESRILLDTAAGNKGNYIVLLDTLIIKSGDSLYLLRFDDDTLFLNKDTIRLDQNDTVWLQDIMDWPDTSSLIQYLSDTTWDATRWWVIEQSYLTQEQDLLWINDSANYLHRTDTTTKVASRHWVLQLGYLKEESDPIWLSDSSDYLHHSDSLTKIASRYWVLGQIHDSIADINVESYWSWVDSATDTLYNNKTGVLYLATDVITDNTLRTENNTVLGRNAGGSFTHSSGVQGWYNTFLGNNAGNIISSGYENTAMGYNALDAATTGYQNVAIGNNVMTAGSGVYRNVGIGYNALSGASYSSNNNVAIGYAAMDDATTADNSVAIGTNALGANQSADYCIAIGSNALSYLTSSANDNYNIAIGYNAGASLDYQNNVLIGHEAGRYLGQCQENVALGKNALFGSTSGVYNSSMNVAIGNNAGYSISGGAMGNTIIGTGAGAYLTTGDYNVVIGNYTGSAMGSSGLTTQNSQLWIDASSTGSPLIKGDFNMDTLRINGALSIRDVSTSVEKYFLVLDSATHRICKMDTTGWGGGGGGVGVESDPIWTSEKNSYQANADTNAFDASKFWVRSQIHDSIAGLDHSSNNEGVLDVKTAGANSSAISSNTSGSPDIYIKGGENITITESGDTIFIAGSGGASGDNLGDHNATENLMLNGFDIKEVDSLYASNIYSVSGEFESAIEAISTSSRPTAVLKKTTAYAYGVQNPLQLQSYGTSTTGDGIGAGIEFQGKDDAQNYVLMGNYQVMMPENGNGNETSKMVWQTIKQGGAPTDEMILSSDSLTVNGGLRITGSTLRFTSVPNAEYSTVIMYNPVTKLISYYDTTGLGGSGAGGDMFKSTYDTDSDNIVDNSEKVNNALSNGYGIMSLSFDGSSPKSIVIDTATLKTVFDGGGNGGDMYKLTYDTDNDGIVDNAEKVNNALSNGYGILTLSYDGSATKSIVIDTALLKSVFGGTGGGDVYKVGTPVNNQVAVWTGDGTIEGDSDLMFDGSKLTASKLYISSPALGSSDYDKFLVLDASGSEVKTRTGSQVLSDIGAEAAQTKGNLTENVPGLQFDNARQVIGGHSTLSLTSGYVIPTTSQEANWNAAYGWGNHALAGYLTTEADPQVGVITANYLSKWDGSALSTSHILDHPNYVRIEDSLKVTKLRANETSRLVMWNMTTGEFSYVDTAAYRDGGGGVIQEMDPVWISDSIDYLHHSDTTTKVASRHWVLDQGYITETDAETDPVWISDSTDYLHHSDTTTKVASRHWVLDQGYITETGAETDPVWISDSTDYLHHSDTTTKVASRHWVLNQGYITETGAETDPVWISDSADYLHHSDTTTRVASRHWVLDQGYITETEAETDPVWISDSTDYLHHSDTTSKVASRHWVLNQGFLLEIPEEKDPQWIHDSAAYLHHSDTLTKVASRKWVTDQAYISKEEDPQVGSSNTTNYLSKWDGLALNASQVYNDGNYVRIPNALKIGSGSPTTSLDIDGSAAIDGTLSVNDIKLTNASAGTSLVALVLDGGQNVDLNTLSDDFAAIEDSSKWSKSGSYVFPKTLTDYVGIGTNTPSGLFHVYGNMYIGKTAGNPIKPRIINNEVPSTYIQFDPGAIVINPDCYIQGDLLVSNDFHTDEINTEAIVEMTSGNGITVKDWGGTSIVSFSSNGTLLNRPARIPVETLSNQTSVVSPSKWISVYIIDADANIEVWCDNAIIGAGQLFTVISDNADDQSYTITLKDYGAGSVITTIPIDPSYDTKAVTLLYTGSKWVVYSTGND